MNKTSIIEIDHPIFNDCQVTLDCEIEYNKPDRTVGILGGWVLLDYEVLKINDKKYSKQIKNCMRSFIEKDYHDEILEGIV